MFKTLSELLNKIDIEDFVSYDNITVEGLRDWGELNDIDMDYYPYFDLLKIIEYIQDKVYEKR